MTAKTPRTKRSKAAAAVDKALNKDKLAAFVEGRIKKGFVLGKPGTGKTYLLCNEIIPALRADNPGCKIIVLAFTNKACKVIRDYFASFDIRGVDVTTIHRYLGLVPTVNDFAMRDGEVQSNSRFGSAKECDVLVIDEVGMVDDELEGLLEEAWFDDKFEKALYLGDYAQLKPINGEPAIIPQPGDWVTELDEIRRSSCPDLQDLICRLSDRIHGLTSGPRITLKVSDNIVSGYPADAARVVAFRNRQVQMHNAQLQKRSLPVAGDRIYCDTVKDELTVLEVIDPQHMHLHPITPVRPYTTKKDGMSLQVFTLDDETDIWNNRATMHTMMRDELEGDMLVLKVQADPTEQTPEPVPFNIVTVFGTGSFRETQRNMTEAGLRANKAVMRTFGLKAKDGSNDPGGKVVAPDGMRYKDLRAFCDAMKFAGGLEWEEKDVLRERGQAWIGFFTFKNHMYHADFVHARTVHAMQGSSEDTVFVDYSDISRADDDTYHRLLYVAVSRARNKVIF